MEELNNYIRISRANGDNDETIINNLKSAGWASDLINEGMKATVVPAVPANPPVTASPLESAEVKKNSFSMKNLMRYGKYPVAVLILAGLGFGGFRVYSYFVGNPQTVWKDSVKEMSNIKSAKFKFEASYTDAYDKSKKPEGDDYGITSILGKDGSFKISATGNGSMTMNKQSKDADYDMDSKIGTDLGSLSISIGFQSRKVGDNIYYKMSGNPLIGLFGGLGGNKDTTAEWLKADLSTDNGSSILSDLQKNQLIDAFGQAKLMEPTKLLGSENINGVAAWHYQASLDKTELKNYFAQIAKTLDQESEFNNYQKIVDRIEFKKLEVWIGKADHRIHQAEIETNAPSYLNSIVGSSLSTASVKSRDARRIADIHQLQTALELYYNDCGNYPKTVSAISGQKLYSGVMNGRTCPSSAGFGNSPSGITYLGQVPSAPAPADGACTETTNTYTYQQLKAGQDYSIKFCLGQDSGGFKPGIAEANSSGISTITPLKSSPADPFEGIPFTATLHMKLNLEDYNSSIKIEAPNDVYDPAPSNRDNKRIEDVSSIRSALSTFFFYNNRYPASSNGQPVGSDGGSKTFSSLLKTYPNPPKPADGNCKDSENQYYYQQQSSGSSYRLTFCLGQKGKYSDFKAGMNEVGPFEYSSGFRTPNTTTY